MYTYIHTYIRIHLQCIYIYIYIHTYIHICQMCLGGGLAWRPAAEGSYRSGSMDISGGPWGSRRGGWRVDIPDLALVVYVLICINMFIHIYIYIYVYTCNVYVFPTTQPAIAENSRAPRRRRRSAAARRPRSGPESWGVYMCK